MATSPPLDAITDPTQRLKFVLERYEEAMDYYWRGSRRNKAAFKWSRLSTIVLGSVVTLVASLSSAAILRDEWKPILAVATPILAALLTVIGTLAQTFQWEASWRETVMTAERLKKEYDRILVSDAAQLNVAQELNYLNDLVLHESEGFFDRILGRSKPPEAEKPA